MERIAPSEQIILGKTQIPLIGTIANEPYFDQNVIAEYAELFRENLLKLS
jgi:dethiobiotin synthetase